MEQRGVGPHFEVTELNEIVALCEWVSTCLVDLVKHSCGLRSATVLIR